MRVNFTNQSSGKSRPVLVVSKDSLNKGNQDVVVAPISKTRRALNDEHSIKIENEQLDGPGLKVSPSAIQTGKVFITHKMWFDDYVGQIAKEKLAETLEKIRDVFVIE